MKSRHFTIHDANEEIRQTAESLQRLLDEQTGFSHSKAKVIHWALKQAVRKLEKSGS